jgi:hypothetical protein
MPTDFSDYTGLIPTGTVAVLQAHVRFGDGTDNVLKLTKNGDAEGLDLELTLLDTQYAKQKLFWFALVTGETDGQKSMAERNLATLKKIIDSAKFLDPNDKSAEARAKRSLGWRDFDTLRFLAEIGIEPGRDGYPDKNVIAKVITRDHPLWNGRPPIDQVGPDFGGPAPTGGAGPSPASSGGATVTPIAKPAWAS